MVRAINDNALIWAEGDWPRLVQAIANMDAVSLDAEVVQDAWPLLGEAASRISVGRLIPVATNVAKIFQHLSLETGAPLARKIIAWASGSLATPGGSPKSEAATWYEVIQAVLDAFSDRAPKVSQQLLATVSGPALPEAAFAVALASAAGRLEYQQLNCRAPVSGVAKEFSSYITTDGADTYRVLSQLESDEFQPYVADLGEQIAGALIQASTVGTYVELGSIHALVKIASSRPEEKLSNWAALKSLVLDGSILALCFRTGVGNSLSLSLCVWLTWTLARSVTPEVPKSHPKYGDLSAATKWYRAGLDGPLPAVEAARLASWVEGNWDVTKWIDAATSAPVALTTSVLEAIADRGSFERIAVDEFPFLYPKVRELIGVDRALRLLDYVDDWEFEGKFETASLTSLSPILFEDIATAKRENLDWFFRALDSQVEEFTHEQWKEALDGADGTIQLMIARHRTGAGYPPTEPFRTALIAQAERVLRNPKTIIASVGKWRDVIGLLKPIGRQKFIRDLYLVLGRTSPTQETWDRFYGLYGHLIPLMPLMRNIATTIDRVVIPLLASTLPDSRDIWNRVLPELEALATKASKSARSRLEKALAAASNSSDPIVREKVPTKAGKKPRGKTKLTHRSS